ncbi:hypothetical protein D3C86_1631000 [compost metagenome]
MGGDPRATAVGETSFRGVKGLREMLFLAGNRRAGASPGKRGASAGTAPFPALFLMPGE